MIEKSEKVAYLVKEIALTYDSGLFTYITYKEVLQYGRAFLFCALLDCLFINDTKEMIFGLFIVHQYL